MSQPRIPYVDVSKITDPVMLEEFDRARRQGTPRPESHAIRANVPPVFWAFVNAWRDTFVNGVCDHAIKELCRLYVSKSVNCAYCGNQRSTKAFGPILMEDDVKDLLNFEKSTRYDERQKTALTLAQAITWGLDLDDAAWDLLYKHFSKQELTELGFFIGLTMGQQRFNRLLGLEHNVILPGTSAGLAASVVQSTPSAK